MSAPVDVLLADDDEVGRYVIAAALRRNGFDVREVEDGGAAVAAATDVVPDLVVLDVKMPVLDGFAACAAIKQDPRTANVPILLLSATFLESEYQVRGLESGADAYLTQPVETPVLVATLRSLLRARAAEQQVRAAAEEWRTTFDAITDAVCVLGAGREVLRANRAFAALAGLAPEEDLRERTPLHVLLPEVEVRLAAGEDAPELRLGDRVVVVRRHGLPDDREVLTLIDVTAAREADAVRRATAERDRRISRLLQRGLLPDALAEVPGVALAARHLPFGEGSLVGGDWYESFALADGTLWLVMGDAAGHGVETAAKANELRHSLRVYAREGYAPADVLGRLNDALVDDQLVGLATCAVVRLDPRDGVAEVVLAGHPPLVLVGADGRAEVLLDDARGPVLGVPGVRWPTARRTLSPGDRLVLYTDGLVERPEEVIDAGLARLATVATGLPEPPAAAVDQLLAELPGTAELRDDVAVLVASWSDPPS